ncbi:MAG: cytochrome C [Gammaproteobacteria bacterium]|nr:cytochrome C [Gammaproteobacteria bacterium]
MSKKPKTKNTSLTYSLALLIGMSANTAVAGSNGLEPIERLGKKIFFDEKLSINRNQSCATCHVPGVGWVGDDPEINEHGAVYEGSIKGAFGDRKPPSSAYATLAPIFYADFGNRLVNDPEADLSIDPLFVGGNFWDGRATGWELGNPAADQAQGPFLNPVEQALPDTACVVYRVCNGKYGDLFDKVWSPNACMITWPNDIQGQCSKTDGVVDLSTEDRNKVERAYDRIALSIAAFEASSDSNAFTSKIDAHRAGFYDFNEQEELGRQIFRGKGMCSACHVGTPGPGAAPPLFTDFTYDNLGVPRNPENPFSIANPEWADPGLAGFIENVAGYEEYAHANLGKQKVPTLRNVGLGSCEAQEYSDDGDHGHQKGRGEGNKCITKAYMHNGFFKSLKSVVNFYNTRDTKTRCENLGIYDATEKVALANNCWPAPEVAANVNSDELGDLKLTEAEEEALVAFMMAMSDGYMEASHDDDGDDNGKRKGKDD